MTDAPQTPETGAPPRRTRSLYDTDARTRRRNAAETRFRAYGIAAIATGLVFLVVLLASIVWNGLPAFTQTYITLQVELPEEKLDKSGTRDLEVMKKVSTFGYNPLLDAALAQALAENGIENPFPKAKALRKMLSASAAAELREAVLADPGLVGQSVSFRLLASSRVDGYLKGRVTRDALARDKNLDPAHLDLVDALRDAGVVRKTFNWGFIFGADASESRPEAAGIGVSMLGSLFMMLVVLALALPIGVAASIYLCRPRSARRRWASAPRRCRRCFTMCCRWRCPASSPAPSSALRRPSARPRRCF